MVAGEMPGKKLLHSESGVQQECAGQAKEHETRRILLEGHLHVRINRGKAIDEALKRKTCRVEEGPFPGEDPFHVPAQGLHQDGDDSRKQHVLNCAVEIHVKAF